MSQWEITYVRTRRDQEDLRARQRPKLGAGAMTSDEWVARWWDIFNDLVWVRMYPEDAVTAEMAEQECTEKHGPRPEPIEAT